MNSEQYLAFVILRKAGRIGRVWPIDCGYMLAPLAYGDGTPISDGATDHQYNLARYITTQDLCLLVDTLTGLVVRKPVGSSADYLVRLERKYCS